MNYKSANTSSLKIKERNKTADLAKGLAVVFMIQVHIMELFARQDIFENTFGKISLFFGGPPAAPVFMAVMGYFLYLSRRSWIENFQRGIKLIIGGLLLNIGLNFHLLIAIYNGEFDINPWQYVFGADIFTLAGLSVIALAFLKKIFKENLIPYIITIPIILFLSQWLPDLSNDPESPLTYIQAFFYGMIKWSYFPFFPWFIYPLAGFIFSVILKEHPHLLKNKFKTIVVSVSGLIILLTIDFASNISHDLQSYYHHNEVFALWVFAFLVAWIFCLNYLLQKTGNNILWKYFCWLGKNVTPAYVFQWLIIGNIATSVYKTQSLMNSVFWFIGIMLVVSLFVYLYRKYFSEKIKIRYSLFS